MNASEKKALFRAKLNAQKKESRIDSPLVRYNESDQPVCRICNVILKSEAMWNAHQVSRKHNEAIEKFKANAVGNKHMSTATPAELQKAKQESKPDLLRQTETLAAPLKSQLSSALPPDFFDSQAMKRQKTVSEANRATEPTNNKSAKDFDSDIKDEKRSVNGSKQATLESTTAGTNQAERSLPEGFFDNKDADLRARGIKLAKPDAKEEYKEFEKLIQEDLKEVDDRLEEEEIDAAEMIEEAEIVEQRVYREKVETLKKKKMELMAARSVNRKKDSETGDRTSAVEESSSSSEDDDDDCGSAVDWRAQHL